MKQGLVCENWRLGSGLMAWFNHLNPKGRKTCNFIGFKL